MFPEWTWIVGLAIGAAIGSFLNVVIYRMPRGISLGKPTYSFCPKCNHRLYLSDMIPLLSWLLQKGRCRYCDEKVSSRYFFVELANGIIWAGIWQQYLIADSDVGKAVAYSLAAAALVAIIWVDLELYMIPDQINAFLAFVGFGYNAWLYYAHRPEATTWGIPSSLAGWVVGVAVLWGIAFLGRVLFGKDAMGHGDVKMARGVGAILFPMVAGISFGLAVALGAVLGVVQILVAKGRHTVPEGDASAEGDDEEYVPESIGSLLKCGLGYMLGFDILGLFYVPFYKAYFGEDPYLPPDDLETFDAGPTMIPFGPYLALGAILAAVFAPQLVQAVQNYLNWSGISGS